MSLFFFVFVLFHKSHEQPRSIRIVRIMEITNFTILDKIEISMKLTKNLFYKH